MLGLGAMAHSAWTMTCGLEDMVRDMRRYKEGCNGVGEIKGRRRPAYIAKFYAKSVRFSYLYS